MSKSGTRPWVPGFEAIHEVKGPMARSVEDIELACRVLFGRTDHSYDDLPPIPYRDVSLPEKLKFGYYKSGKQAISLNVKEIGDIKLPFPQMRWSKLLPLSNVPYKRRSTH